MRSTRLFRVAAAALAAGSLALGLVALVVLRPRRVEYRAVSPGCEARVVYATGEGPRELRIRGERHLGPVSIAFGDVARVMVFPDARCASTVRCELLEEGVTVAASEGMRGAICTAATAR